jgi:murein L,D-transpeptidase YcbB/YkuD
MRATRFDRLLAGTILAAAVAVPTFVAAAPRVETVYPAPPSLNGRVIRHHEPAQEPPPAARAQALPPRHEAAPAPQPAAVRPEPAPVPEPAPAREADNKSSVDLSGALDRMFSASDAQIAPKLKEIVTSKQLDKRIERPADRRAIEAFYAARGYAPLWVHEGRLTAQAKAAIGKLKNAADDGLDVADYPVPEFGTINGADALAAGDLKLTESVLTYTRHLAVGRIAPTRVSAEVEYGDHTPDPDDVLKKLASASDAGAAIESYNPPNQGFRALKAKLAELRTGNASADVGPARIPDGPAIKFGMKDARVPQLREKLGLHGKPADILYDKALYNAVRSVQFRKGMKPSGIVDAQTIAVINGPKPGDLVARVRANMERWRWLPRDLGRTYVMVNIPDYTLKVVQDGRQVWTTKIVSGKPQTPTPLVSAPMQHIIVNPSWYVPQSIIQNELLPLYASDPQIFDRMGLEVKQGPDGHINVVQPPGAANALGRIKFAFPNKFQVYLHDTPEKKLFSYDKRAFSHGCMRVQDPTKFGEVMLSLAMAGPTPNERQLDRMFGQEEKTYNLQKQPMVHLTYQTVYVDEAGKMHVDEDLYGFDARIHSILHSDERRVADVAPPQDPKRDLSTDKANQEILRRVERREAQNPFAFFDKLFR